MRLLTFALLAPVALASVLIAQEKVNQPFSITVSALKPSYKAGSAVELKVVMTNTSDHVIDAGAVYERTINTNYEYDVQDSMGERAPLKENKVSDRRTVMTRTLKPGESVSDITNVARWVDFSKPGEYVIQVSRHIDDDEKQGVIKSNTITITIVEPPPPAAAPQ
jgi:hypothetical protein